MKKSSSATVQSKRLDQKLTIGLDLGDRSSCYGVLDETGVVVDEQKARPKPPQLRRTCRDTGWALRRNAVRMPGESCPGRETPRTRQHFRSYSLRSTIGFVPHRGAVAAQMLPASF